jgi:aryl-alcohol dehydrogenase-like predicted oxidoreductase
MDRVAMGPLEVSRLCLGTMLMGDKTPEDEAHRMLDAFVAAGHNFIDTADVYVDGVAEQVLAPWLARRRDEVVVATKVRFPVSDPGGEGLAPERIRKACDASLRRMGIDTIDLYMLHAPDPSVPIEDTLEVLDELVREGKVRALGTSNYPAWLLAWALRTQDCEGWSPFVAFQAQYSLVERSAELDMLPCCRATGVGVMAWGPLGGGFFTGRHRPGTEPAAGSRLAEAPDDVEEAPRRRAIERNFRAVDEAEAVAEECDATLTQVAIAWLLHQPGVTAPVLGPRTEGQLADLLPAAGLRLSEEQIRRLGAYTEPPEVYPHRMLAQQTGVDPARALKRP